MAKTIILDDETYNALKKEARAEDRSISKTAKRLIQMGLQTKTMTQTVTQAMTQAMTVEEPNEEESKPTPHYERGYEMSDEEMLAYQQSHIR